MRKQWIIFVLISVLAAACAPLAVGETPAVDVTDETDALPEESDAPDQLSPEEKPPAGAESQFTTDFSNRTIPYTEVLSGGPPKDGIPAIDSPAYVSIADADQWLEDAEAVVVVEVDGTARAYPVQILMWHEIVNDTLNGQGVSVTYCPLCNTAIAFDRDFDGQQLDFGTTGRLRFSNLIMYDRQTETWWQQATGEGIAGEYAGEVLTSIPAFLVSWEQFRRDFPQGDVLSRRTGFQREYGSNPYVGYDAEFNDPFLYQGPETPDALPPLARVLTIDRETETVAFPYSVLEDARVINETVADEPIVVFWQAGTASALDRSSVSGGKDVGAATSFSRALDGQVLTFEVDGENFRDRETGTLWNNAGVALSGALAGQSLAPVVSINHFWFSWVAFRPDTRIVGQEGGAQTGDAAGAGEAPPSVEPVGLAQDFTFSLYQGDENLTGDSAAFSEVFEGGKPVAAMFFAGLCHFCRVDLPLFQAAYDQAGDQINMVALDIGPYTNLGSQSDGQALLADLSITVPAGALDAPAAISTYRILGTPAFLFFDAQGELMRSWVGSIKADQLAEFISEIT